MRTYVTRLPAAGSSPGLGLPGVFNTVFLDNPTVGFLSTANVSGKNPEGRIISVTVKIDGRGALAIPPPVALPGAQIVPAFQITGDRPVAVQVFIPGETVNQPPLGAPFSTIIEEVFLLDGRNL